MTDVFLMIRRKKSTIFLSCKETDTVAVLKKMLSGIVRQEAEGMKVFQQCDNAEKELDNAASMESLGFLSSICKPMSPGAIVLAWNGEAPEVPVLNINDHATGGRRTKDILGGPKGWGPKKKVANIEIYVIFEVFAFCGRRTKTDFKDRARRCVTASRTIDAFQPPLRIFWDRAS